jgi:glutamyl-Q tRNA(Asp) synthetase
VAAVASYLDARARCGGWLVRIEDVDEPRTVPGAASEILRCLESYGLEWDGEVVYQSQRKDLYRAALAALGSRVFGCDCPRRQGVYPGTCRWLSLAGRAKRLRVDDAVIEFEDRLRGPQVDDLARTTGDFVLLRADGFFAYQLAVVVDDGEQGVTDAVRGEDLLESTGRQILLQRLLGLPALRYLHIPVVRDANGEKLSKQNLAAPVELGSIAELTRALRFLGYDPPEFSRANEALAWACNQPLLDCKKS